MKLITKEIERKLIASPLYSHDGDNAENVQVIAKFFNAYGAGTWYITEAEKLGAEDGNGWMFYGLAEIGYDAELGYVMSDELNSLPGIERDLYWTGTLADAKRKEAI